MRPRVRDALLLTLTAAAGSADAVSFLGLGRVLTANMTGNMVLLGIAIGQGQLAGSIRSVIAFAAFVVGVLIGVRVTARTEPTAVWPRSATLALLGELGLLLGLLAGWELTGDRPGAVALDILIALSTVAMGMQTAAARRLGVVGVTTTFVTGMLTNLIAELAAVGAGSVAPDNLGRHPRLHGDRGRDGRGCLHRLAPRCSARRHAARGDRDRRGDLAQATSQLDQPTLTCRVPIT